MERIAELDKLYYSIENYRSVTNYQELMKYVSQFKHLAPYNAMLVQMQKPGSTYVLGAEEWISRFNRSIKPGARPIVILRQFGPVSFVFDYSDTIGDKPLPRELVEPFRVEFKISKNTLERLIDELKKEGIRVETVDYGGNYAGFVKRDRETSLFVYNSKYVYEIKSEYVICLNKNVSIAVKYVTLLHELGHYLCGHLNTGEYGWLPSRLGLTLEQREFEAESVAWLVCNRQGIDACSEEYLHGYYMENKEIPNISIDTVLKVTGSVEKYIQGNVKIREELIKSKKEITTGQMSLFDG